MRIACFVLFVTSAATLGFACSENATPAATDAGASDAAATPDAASTPDANAGDAAATVDAGVSDAALETAVDAGPLTNIAGAVGGRQLKAITAIAQYNLSEPDRGELLLAALEMPGAPSTLCALFQGTPPTPGTNILDGEITYKPKAPLIPPGTYPFSVDQKWTFISLDADGGQTPEPATDASLVVATSTSSAVSGTVSVTFPSGSVSGSFEATICP